MARLHSLLVFSSVVVLTFALTTATHGQNTQSTQNTATKAPPKSQPAVPVTMTECEGTNNCATWTFLGLQGNGQWPSGEVANLNVEASPDSDTVVIRRADSTGSSAGLTAIYTGTRHGDRVAGEFTSSWPGHWNNKSGNWYATVQKPQSPPPVMRVCDPPSFCGIWTWNNGHYDGFWSVGGPPGGRSPVTAKLTVVSFSPESVIINRTDTSPAPRVGYTYVYTGKISADGNRIVNGNWSGTDGSGHFTASWGAALEDAPPPAQLAPQRVVVPVVPVICVPWFFGVVCG
jgi:hypothetical protein